MFSRFIRNFEGSSYEELFSFFFGLAEFVEYRAIKLHRILIMRLIEESPHFCMWSTGARNGNLTAWVPRMPRYDLHCHETSEYAASGAQQAIVLFPLTQPPPIRASTDFASHSTFQALAKPVGSVGVWHGTSGCGIQAPHEHWFMTEGARRCASAWSVKSSGFFLQVRVPHEGSARGSCFSRQLHDNDDAGGLQILVQVLLNPYSGTHACFPKWEFPKISGPATGPQTVRLFL